MNWDENFINLHYLVFLKFYIFKFAPIPPKAGLIGSNFRGAAHRNSCRKRIKNTFKVQRTAIVSSISVRCTSTKQNKICYKYGGALHLFRTNQPCPWGYGGELENYRLLRSTYLFHILRIIFFFLLRGLVLVSLQGLLKL